MSTNSRKEKMALTLEMLLKNYIAPEYSEAAEILEAKKMLAAYWTSREACRRDAWNRQPDWLKSRQAKVTR